MKALNTLEIQAVNGAHGAFPYLFLLELPHAFMGFKEFVNYLAGLKQNGCQGVEEDDYFTQYFCDLVS